MRILITNDDGINAIGLIKLVKCALKYGEVFVVAPKEEQSAKSHSICVRSPIEFKETKEISKGVKTYYAASTPADCVRIARFYLKEKFDIVLSGVNKGYNLGEDIVYSGTCAAATEAAMLNRKGIAFSCSHKSIDDIDSSLEYVMEYIFKNKLYDKYELLNVNIPLGSREICFSRQGNTHYYSEYFNEGEDFIESKGRPEANGDSIPLSDVEFTHQGKITITPLNYQRTNEEALNKLLNE